MKNLLQRLLLRKAALLPGPESPGSLTPVGPGKLMTRWEQEVLRLRHAPNSQMHRYLFLGEKQDGSPFYMHRNILGGHTLILGETGTHKTSKVFAPVTEQLIAHRKELSRAEGRLH